MSTYGPANGIWTAGSVDLLTTILRNEWDFDGIVMTDRIMAALAEGRISRKQIQQNATRVYRMADQLS